MLVLAETSPMTGDEALHRILSPPLKREAIKTAAFNPRPLVHMLARVRTDLPSPFPVRAAVKIGLREPWLVVW